MFEQFMTFLASLNDNVIWGIPMVVLMIGTGLFLLIVTKGVIFRHFGIVMRYTTKTLFQKKDKSQQHEGDISPFQAVCTALAATVGTGNIVGVALAIATGGPGAMFWLWLSALVGMYGSPVASASAVMAEEMGGDAEQARQYVVWTSAFSMITLFLWIFLLRAAGLL